MQQDDNGNSTRSDDGKIVKSAVCEQALKFIEMQHPDDFQKAIEYLAFITIDGKIPNKLSYYEKKIVRRFNIKAHELGLISEKYTILPSVQRDLHNFFTVDDNANISISGRAVLLSVYNHINNISSEIKAKSETELSRKNSEPKTSEYVRKFVTRDKKHIASWQKKRKDQPKSDNESSKAIGEYSPEVRKELSRREKNFENWGRF